MSQYNNQKDEFFYDDLIYEIKRLSGLKIKKDDKTEERINLRKKETITEEDGIPAYVLSDFSLELFLFFVEIQENLGIKIKETSELINYQKEIKNHLKKYQSKKKLKKRSQ